MQNQNKHLTWFELGAVYSFSGVKEQSEIY